MAKPPKAQEASAPKKATLPASIVNALPTSAEIMRRLVEATALTGQIAVEMEEAKSGGAVALARAFVAFHRMRERIDELFKPMSLLFEQYKIHECPDVFEQAGVPNVSLDEGFRVGISHRFTASILPDKKNEAYNWLTTNQLGDLIVTTVNSQTLTAAAKALMEEHNRELPPEYFKTANVPNTSVTTLK